MTDRREAWMEMIQREEAKDAGVLTFTDRELFIQALEERGWTEESHVDCTGPHEDDGNADVLDENGDVAGHWGFVPFSDSSEYGEGRWEGMLGDTSGQYHEWICGDPDAEFEEMLADEASWKGSLFDQEGA